MIRISDADVVRKRRPVVNIALVAINVVVFVYELSLSDFETFRFTYRFGAIASELTSGEELLTVPVLTNLGAIPLDVASPIHPWGTIFTSMFMHGSWMHLLMNMLFLWFFGDYVENRLGHLKYLLFYLVAGIAAAWAQVAIDLDSEVPLIGASGAISGVLGAYLLIYPPAMLFLGFYFVSQLFYGVGSLTTVVSGVGIAYMAHVGGFVVGLLLMAGYKRLLREPIWPRHRWRSWR